MKPQMTPTAKIGDLVTIKGYGNRVFRVASLTHEITYEKDAEYEDIYYDCHCVTNDEYMLGSQDDITVVCKADMSDRFLENYEHPKFDEISPFNLFEFFNENTEVKPMTTKPETKVLSKQERTDALLDDLLNVYQAMEVIGDADGHYQRRIDEIEAELKEVNDGRR